MRRPGELIVAGGNVRKCQIATVTFVTLMACFLVIARYFQVPVDPATGVSFTLLLAPYWAFGFEAAEWLRLKLNGKIAILAAPLLLTVPYLAFALPRGEFRLDVFAGLTAVILLITWLLLTADPTAPVWRDWLVLAILALSVESHFFDRAWPVAGLSGMAKLLFVDAGLYGYLVARPLSGVGFDFRLRRADLAIGLREFVYFTPLALGAGFALGFLHLHNTPGSPLGFAAGWVFTLFFVALPEELFFRGLMLNMLERRLGTQRALLITSLIFGLAHFNKRAAYFNWR
jgi:uncharacterized protein